MSADIEQVSARSIAGSMERRIRIAAILITVGLLIEVISLRWAHPTAFLVFAFIGCAFIGLGILIFLYSLVSVRQAP